jgi:hypothetical protein
MTIAELLDALRNRDAVLYLDGDGTLKYHGPRLGPDDPIRLAIARWRPELIEIFTYAPGGRCTADGCYSLKRVGDRCADHAETTP